MVPAANRLKGDGNFKRLMKHGRSFFSPTLVLRSVRNNLDRSRFAFVVSVKVSKKTVERNKLKRRLREIVRLGLPGIRGGYDILIAGKKAALACDYLILRDQLVMILGKARLLHDDGRKRQTHSTRQR